jgi:hypothetical protein
VTRVDPPPGYVHFTVGPAEIVAREALADSIRAALRAAPQADRTLYGFAASAPAAWPLAGRGTAYAVALPRSSTRVVVRHNRHGGMLARLTKDLFLPPTRAGQELRTALELERLGVPTPEVVAYAVYRAIPGFRRADVLTAEIESSRDLAAVLMNDTDEERVAAWSATRKLLGALAHARAWHQDLNAKNILLRGAADRSFDAFVLDVDRVAFLSGSATSVMSRNIARLARSARKWGRLYGARVDERELSALASLAAAVPSTRA